MTRSVFAFSFTSKLVGERPNHDRIFKVCSIQQESRVPKLFHKSMERPKRSLTPPCVLQLRGELKPTLELVTLRSQGFLIPGFSTLQFNDNPAAGLS